MELKDKKCDNCLVGTAVQLLDRELVYERDLPFIPFDEYSVFNMNPYCPKCGGLNEK